MKNKKTAIQIVFAVSLGGLCSFAAFRNIDWTAFSQSFQNLDIRYLPLLVLSLFLTHFFRTLRWKILLDPIKNLRFWRVFAIHSVGFWGIYILPFRLGELVRPGVLKKKYQLPMSQTLGTIFVERVLDGVVATILLFGGLLFSKQADHLSGTPAGEHFMTLGWTAAAIFTVLAIFCLGFAIQAKKVLPYLRKHIETNRSAKIKRLLQILENFGGGLSTLPSPAGVLNSIFLSFMVWGTAVLGYWALNQSFGLWVTWVETCAVVGLITVGLMVPGPPGFIGTFHFFVQTALFLFGVDRSLGLAYASVFYVINFLYIFTAGIWGSMVLSQSVFSEDWKSELKSSPKRAGQHGV